MPTASASSVTPHGPCRNLANINSRFGDANACKVSATVAAAAGSKAITGVAERTRIPCPIHQFNHTSIHVNLNTLAFIWRLQSPSCRIVDGQVHWWSNTAQRRHPTHLQAESEPPRYAHTAQEQATARGFRAVTTHDPCRRRRRSRVKPLAPPRTREPSRPPHPPGRRPRPSYRHRPRNRRQSPYRRGNISSS